MSIVHKSRLSELGQKTIEVLPHTVPLAAPHGFKVKAEIALWCAENIQREADLPEPHSVRITEDYLRRRRWIGILDRFEGGLIMRYYFETYEDAFQFKIRWA